MEDEIENSMLPSSVEVMEVKENEHLIAETIAWWADPSEVVEVLSGKKMWQGKPRYHLLFQH